jgi:hypothetical protein
LFLFPTQCRALTQPLRLSRRHTTSLLESLPFVQPAHREIDHYRTFVFISPAP